MLLNQKTIVVYILFFPLLLSILSGIGVGHELNIVYFLFLAGLLVWMLGSKTPIKTIHYDVFLLCVNIFFLIFLCTIGFGGDLRYVMPIIFFIYLLVFTISNTFFKNKDLRKPIFLGLSLYLLFSLIFLFFKSSYALEGRYSGFSTSSTTYSVYITAIVIIGIHFIKNKTLKVFTFIIGFIFVLLSMTRLNLVYYIFIPVIYKLSKFKKLRSLILLSIIILLSLAYPIYFSLIESYPQIVEYRYESGRDASFGLRYALFNTVYKEWLTSDIRNIFFGNGMEASRLLIIDRHKLDLLPHNDFIRILYDFGVLGSLSILFLFIKLFNKNMITFQLGILYLVSFYHNMVYNFFLISLILIFWNFKEDDL
jgi:hypothetical protein